MREPTVTVDLGAVCANWRALGVAAGGDAETGAVLKADGYGLGAAPVAEALGAAGCRTFFVATAAEAERLAPVVHRFGAELFVLSGAPGGPETLARIIGAGAAPVLNTQDEVAWAVAAAADRGAPLRCALQVETGMNRAGLAKEAFRDLCRRPPDGLHVTLAMSHLAAADTPEAALNRDQKRRFDAIAAAARRAFPAARLSLAATGGALLGRPYAYDLTRPGVGLFGGNPFAQGRPVVRLTAPLIRVWDVPAGALSGYGGAWRAERPSVLALAPVGYADGLPRALAGKGAARIGGAFAPFAGRVSMDLIVLDVTDAPTPPVIGDEAAFLDEALTVDNLAHQVGAIGYEILTGLDAARRLARVYI